MRFFFNLAGAIHNPDNEGIELAAISEARIQAAVVAGEMQSDRPEIAWLGNEFLVEVTDENQLLLLTIITLGVDSAAGSLMN